MASVKIAKTSKSGVIREITLIFERVESKPQKVGTEWTTVPVNEDTYSLFWEGGVYPRKMYFTKEDSEELIGIVAEELELKVSFEELNP